MRVRVDVGTDHVAVEVVGEVEHVVHDAELLRDAAGVLDVALHLFYQSSHVFEPTLAAQPLSLQLQQGVPTASPVDFTFGPFLSSTDGSGNHTLRLSFSYPTLERIREGIGRLVAKSGPAPDVHAMD